MLGEMAAMKDLQITRGPPGLVTAEMRDPLILPLAAQTSIEGTYRSHAIDLPMWCRIPLRVFTTYAIYTIRQPSSFVGLANAAAWLDSFGTYLRRVLIIMPMI